MSALKDLNKTVMLPVTVLISAKIVLSGIVWLPFLKQPPIPVRDMVQHLHSHQKPAADVEKRFRLAQRGGKPVPTAGHTGVMSEPYSGVNNMLAGLVKLHINIIAINRSIVLNSLFINIFSLKSWEIVNESN